MIQIINFLTQINIDGQPLKLPVKAEISWEMPTLISFDCSHCHSRQQFNFFEDGKEVALRTPDIPNKELAIGIAQAFQLDQILGGAELIYFKPPYKEASIAMLSLLKCDDCESQYIVCWAESGDYSRSPRILYLQGLARVEPLFSTVKNFFKKNN
ncbi:hypothetical protein [Spirosoma sordidisoli]|uniref:Uncharacterized protein n=1 Tax=Spirosoma sordidisoli TaxID=2502893 RepID=A0A4Q2UL45_9BACT|nr:hypothetical protein [Spirosoma sordidisoli]RYC68215.1 hypothetical protein EQG79_22470 [Spirosoma sordidisoli]